MCFAISSKHTIQRNVLDTATVNNFLIGVIHNFDRKIRLHPFPFIDKITKNWIPLTNNGTYFKKITKKFKDTHQKPATNSIKKKLQNYEPIMVCENGSICKLVCYDCR
jgi:hypothetical protein